MVHADLPVFERLSRAPGPTTRTIALALALALALPQEAEAFAEKMKEYRRAR